MKQLLIIVLFSMSFGAMAQEKTSFGIKAGINFSNTNPAAEIMPGFSVGGFGGYNLSKVFTLQGELLFTKYAYDFKNNVTDPSGGKLLNNFTHLSFSKVELPIIIKATSKTGVIKPFAYFGLTPGINISGNYKQDAYDINPERSGKIENLNAFNLSVSPGIGFVVKEKIIFDARYNVGMTKLYNNSDTKINTFYLTLGYRF